jgi:hypothetical protein
VAEAEAEERVAVALRADVRDPEPIAQDRDPTLDPGDYDATREARSPREQSGCEERPRGAPEKLVRTAHESLLPQEFTTVRW